MKKKAYPGTPFTVGSEGEHVVYIQDALNAFKRKVTGAATLPSDGNFEEKTLHALREFQNLVGLHPDGLVDEDTWEALTEEFISTGFTAVG